MLPALNQAGFELRAYQNQAAQNAYDLLSQGKNVEIDLPTGTGKTLIANQVTWMWLDHRKESRVLYIVPRRILVDQHTKHARWMAPAFYTLALTPEILRNIFRFRALLNAHRLVVSTPELLSNAISSGFISSDYLKQFNFVVIDEYDVFLVTDYNETDLYIRWSEDIEGLINLLPNAIKFLLLSATSPLAASQGNFHDQVVAKSSMFVKKFFDPISLEIPPNQYSQYIPTASVIFLQVSDDWVSLADEALKFEIQDTIHKFEEGHGVTLDRDYLFSRLDGIIKFKVKVLYVIGYPGRLLVDDSVIRLCYRLRDILSKCVFLFEDMFKGFSIQVRKVTIFIDGEFKQVIRPFLIDGRENNLYEAELREKGAALAYLINKHTEQRGVIFTRFIHLSDELCNYLSRNNITFYRIDSRLSDKERDNVLENFKEANSGLLVITRDTGKRGLDLPQADYAIFYSPKGSEHSVWQEISRIRSNVDRTKETYFLCYRGTSEVERMEDLNRQMGNTKRLYDRQVKNFS